MLHRVTTRIQDPAEAATLKLCVMDEAWRFIQHPTLRAYVQEALKTWRKRNAAMLLSTQTIDDFASADLLRTVVESCPTKLLLANPALDRQQYAELFQLNETELELLTNLIPRQQILLKRPDVTKVLTLNVDPKSYWIYTNTPLDNDRVAAIVPRIRLRGGHGPPRGLGLRREESVCPSAKSFQSGCSSSRLQSTAPATSNAQTPGIREVTASPRTLIRCRRAFATQR